MNNIENHLKRRNNDISHNMKRLRRRVRRYLRRTNYQVDLDFVQRLSIIANNVIELNQMIEDLIEDIEIGDIKLNPDQLKMIEEYRFEKNMKRKLLPYVVLYNSIYPL